MKFRIGCVVVVFRQWPRSEKAITPTFAWAVSLDDPIQSRDHKQNSLGEEDYGYANA